MAKPATSQDPTVILDDSVDDFLSKCRLFLEQHEARDHLLFGLSLDIEGGSTQAQLPLFVTVVANRGVSAVAACMPGEITLLSSEEPATAESIAERLHRERPEIPVCVGPTDGADAFARKWSALTGRKHALAKEQTIFRLGKVRAGAASGGTLRVARDSDEPLLCEWVGEFLAEAMAHETRGEEQVKKMVQARLRTRSFFVLEVDGEPVSMAGLAGTTPHGRRLNYVFTPQAARGKGYARSTLAQLCQQILISGKKHCFLYADVRNPAAQRLCESVGFEAVTESRIYLFDPTS